MQQDKPQQSNGEGINTALPLDGSRISTAIFYLQCAQTRQGGNRVRLLIKALALIGQETGLA